MRSAVAVVTAVVVAVMVVVVAMVVVVPLEGVPPHRQEGLAKEVALEVAADEDAAGLLGVELLPQLLRPCDGPAAGDDVEAHEAVEGAHEALGPDDGAEGAGHEGIQEPG